MELRPQKVALKTISYLILFFFALVTLFPFYWMIITALKDSNSALRWPPELWPKTFHWENFDRLLKAAPFGRYFMNSVIVVILDLSISMIVMSFAAFGFAHYNFRGKEILFMLFLATMMIPGEALIITNFRTVAKLGWFDTYHVLFVPYIASVFYIYLLRQAFESVPKQLYLAAKVDGCSDFKYFLKVLLPIARPMLITIVILKVIASWNSFMWPLLVTNSSRMRVISYGLVAFQSEAGNDFPLMMAASIFTVGPMIILYLIARKKIIDGIAKGGIKG
ncbi:MAG: carbohydrate ABC transporter permease [Firmicutes bacterium]|jgi:multiple sugar transport system permease protein|nr:carbohydrate ABC transporter permease [Bacillota bacterium]